MEAPLARPNKPKLKGVMGKQSSSGVSECLSTGAMREQCNALVPRQREKADLSRRLDRHSFGNKGRRRKLGEGGSHSNYF